MNSTLSPDQIQTNEINHPSNPIVNPSPLKILVIIAGPLGNWVVASGIFQDIRTYYPNATIYHLTQPAFYEMARKQGCFDKVAVMIWPRPLNFLEWIQAVSEKFILKPKLHKIGFDLIFDFQGTTQSKQISGRVRNTATKVFSKQREYPHMVHVYRDMLKEAGVYFGRDPVLRYETLNEDDQYVYVNQTKIKKPFSILIPRSKNEHEGRNWPLDKFKRLVFHLTEQGCTPVIVGHQRDRKPLKPLSDMVGCVDLTGETKVEMLGGLFSKASVIVGVNTGPSHIASIIGAPTIGLFGRRDKMEVWGLTGRRASMIYGNGMDAISVDTVWKECLKHLNSNRISETKHLPEISKEAKLTDGKISVVVITFNEESNIRECLESMRWADEIIIVDSWSTDRTVQIAQEYTSKIFQRNWTDFGDQKNFGLSKTQHEWALFIDADQRVSELLAKEIQTAIKENDDRYQGYYVPNQNFYFGKWVQYGEWNPDFKLKLVRKQNATWVGRIHERISLSGRVAYLKNPAYHYTYKNFGQHVQKFISYSSLYAEEAFAKGEQSSLYKIFIKPPRRFVYGYLLRQGFRDGFTGFVIAAMQAFELFLRYVKLWHLQKTHHRETMKSRQHENRTC